VLKKTQMYNVFQKIEKENNLKSLEASIPKSVNRIANVPRCHRPRGGSYRMVAGLTPIGGGNRNI
jgi:hypothetical protein